MADLSARRIGSGAATGGSRPVFVGASRASLCADKNLRERGGDERSVLRNFFGCFPVVLLCGGLAVSVLS